MLYNLCIDNNGTVLKLEHSGSMEKYLVIIGVLLLMQVHADINDGNKAHQDHLMLKWGNIYFMELRIDHLKIKSSPDILFHRYETIETNSNANNQNYLENIQLSMRRKIK